MVIPTLIGEIEQDYLYWPLKYRGIAEAWRTNTAWGQLFQRYQQHGHLADGQNKCTGGQSVREEAPGDV